MRHHAAYGAPRVLVDLVEAGYQVSKKRVARLMRAAGIEGVTRRRRPTTTTRDDQARPAPDLVDRNFEADGPNRLWVADITYVPTLVGHLYLAVVLDVWSRAVVGWSMQDHLGTELVVDALDMAVGRRRPHQEVVHHSDHGCQYTSLAFGARCAEMNVALSMGSVGDAYANMCESFFATLECELIDRVRLRNHEDASAAIFDFIEGFYNPRRRHSALDYLSPTEYERRRANTVAETARGSRSRRRRTDQSRIDRDQARKIADAACGAASRARLRARTITLTTSRRGRRPRQFATATAISSL